jgi:hypothetical protein
MQKSGRRVEWRILIVQRLDSLSLARKPPAGGNQRQAISMLEHAETRAVCGSVGSGLRHWVISLSLARRVLVFPPPVRAALPGSAGAVVQ